MCGILGIWHIDGRPLDLATVRRATTVLRHRGPDDEGYLLVDTASGRTVLCGGAHTAPELSLPRIERFFGEQFNLALGFRRLSILDLSPAGHQPMSSPDGRFWLVFNGEVYNYIELRSELCALGYDFHTGSDTEVVLAAYEEWGPDCLKRFNGMWGFALWDNVKRELFVARDRFGVKPFHTVTSEKTFVFASEIKAILAMGVVPFRPSPLAVAGYVAQGRFPSHEKGETFFEGVQSLPGSHYALISQEGRVSRRYWRVPSREDVDGAQIEEATRRYGELFTDAVRLRLRADVAVGTCLSGGLDSSSIVATGGWLMRHEHAVSLERLGDHQQTFSAVYDTQGPWNERHYIEQVAEKTGAGANYVVPTGERLWADLERLVWHQDEPFQSTSIFAQWCVMDLARQRGATVLLDGQGADEALGGYRPFATWLAQLLRSGRFPETARVMRQIHAVTGLNPAPLLARAMVLQLPAPVLARLRGTRLKDAISTSGLTADLGDRLLARQIDTGESYADQRDMNDHLARLLVEDSLPSLLRYEDRNSMAFSIEARLPFLDYRLVEYVFTQAASLRIHDGWTKWLQRVAVEDKLPSEVVWRRDKVGFETPEQQWFREGKQRLLDILNADDTGSEYVDLAAIRREAPRLLDAPVVNTARVWRWANLLMWLRCFSGARDQGSGIRGQGSEAA
ncbi:MAG TPA: asparagine synthase (glutamine-hydrolyzing) [Chloroflexia bacterium]|nr:asparagine synthase (glutamine-hydrolyzing) [Chloroflexia bacterium]